MKIVISNLNLETCFIIIYYYYVLSFHLEIKFFIKFRLKNFIIIFQTDVENEVITVVHFLKFTNFN